MSNFLVKQNEKKACFNINLHIILTYIFIRFYLAEKEWGEKLRENVETSTQKTSDHRLNTDNLRPWEQQTEEQWKTSVPIHGSALRQRDFGQNIITIFLYSSH